MNDTILEIKDLHVLFPVHKKWLPAVDGVNLKIEKGEITGVVGESGSGKSVMSQTILRLRDHDTNVRYEGEILFEGEDLLKQPLNKIRDIRGDRISVIFQDPLTSLSPVHTVGSQLSEVLTLHKGLNKEQAKEKAIEMLKLTGIPNPENCFKQYPYELSGGMQQRVMIAMALSCEPKLLIAHDMGAVANLCHNVKVMYLGQVVEEASTEELFQNPLHPYTQGLLSCIPHLGVKKGEPLPVIEGSVPPLSKVPVGCHFCTRCKMADQQCMEHEPPACEVAPGHVVKCWKYAESGKQEV